VNPYGNLTSDDNSNPYPLLDDKKTNPMDNNPFNLVIGAKLFGQQQQFPQQPPQQQPPNNAFNILDMAAKGVVQPQNGSGWGQQPGQGNQWNQLQQNQGWGPPNQPNNAWQNNNKGSGW
jgi:hypothetical protein